MMTNSLVLGGVFLQIASLSGEHFAEAQREDFKLVEEKKLLVRSE